jgi:hypothetical protein
LGQAALALAALTGKVPVKPDEHGESSSETRDLASTGVG